MTPARMRQARDRIRERLVENQKRDLRTLERTTGYLASAVFAAAGSKQGAKQALKFTLLPREVGEVDATQVARMFGAGPRGGQFTREQIEARARELAAQREEATP